MNRKNDHPISGSARADRTSTDRNAFEGEDSDPVTVSDDEEPPGRGCRTRSHEKSNEVSPFVSRRISDFRHRYHPVAGDDEWNNLPRQFKLGIHTLEGLEDPLNKDTPGRGGKIPFNPDYIQRAVNGRLTLKNYEEKIYEYPDDSLSFDSL